MSNLYGIRVVYIGDWVFYTGPDFIESPFEMIAKDCQLHFLGKPVVDALQADGAEVEAYSNWQLYHFSPEEYDRILARNDLIIVSDVEARCFQLDPAFFDRARYGKEIITFPDRLKKLVRAVEDGKGLLYLGGWLGFSGHMEKGGWRRSSIADWLPFTCLTGDDLMESSAGFTVSVTEREHPAIRDLRLDTLPPLLGYNEFIPKPALQILWSIAETGHPLLGVSEHGHGRLVTYGSDPVPHWGINLMLWEDYARFWQRLAQWAVKRDV